MVLVIFCSIQVLKVSKYDSDPMLQSCAVRIKSGQIKQPEALGISAELKSKVALLSLFFIL